MTHEKELRTMIDRVANGSLSRRDALRRAAAMGAGAAIAGIAGKGALAQDASPAASPAAAAEQYEPQGPQVEKLLLWTNASPDTDPNQWGAIEAVAARYTELVGTPIELVTVPTADFRTKLSQAAPGGDGPDVFGPVAHDWIGEVALQQIAMPWEDGEIFGFDDIPQSAIDAVMYDGKVYGYPIFTESLALFYNTDMVPEPPKTWEELVSMATELTNEEEETYGFSFEILQQYYQGAFFHAYGSYIFKNNDGTLDFEDIGLNNEGGVEAAKALRDMFHMDQPPMPEAILDQANAAQYMDGLEEAGRLGMRINGPWREPALRDAGIPFAVAPLPTAPNGEPLMPFSGVQVFEVNAYSEQVEAAKDLVNYIGSVDGVTLLVEGYSKPPARTSMRGMAEEFNPNLVQYMEQAENAVPMPNIPQMAQVWQPWGDAMIGIVTNNVPDEEVQSLLDTAVEQIKANIQQ